VKLINGLVAVEEIQPTKVLPKLRLDSDLNEVVLEEHTIVLAYKSTANPPEATWVYTPRRKQIPVHIEKVQYETPK